MDKPLSHRTATLLALAATASLSSAALGQTGPDLLLGQFGEGKNVVAEGEALFFATGDTEDADEDVQLQIYNASARVKLDLDTVVAGLNRAQPRAGFQMTHLHFSSDDAALPDQFTDVSVGIGLGIAKSDKWVAGISVALGHASANSFNDGNAFYGKADLAFAYDLNDREKLGVVIDYNGNRTFLPDVPLPGFIYTRKLSDQFTLEVGFPYSDIQWKPDERWTVLLKFVFPDGGEANVDYKVTESFHVFAGLAQQNEAFHWNQIDGGDHEDRVIFTQTRAEVGVRGTYREDLNFVLAGGYAFNTDLEVGWDSRDTDDLAELSDEPYVRVGVEVKF